MRSTDWRLKYLLTFLTTQNISFHSWCAWIDERYSHYSLFQHGKQTSQKKKKYFSLLFVEMLHKFSNDGISKKMAMIHIWTAFNTKLKSTTEDLFKGKTRNFSFLFCSLHSTKSIWKKQTLHEASWENKELFPRQLPWKKDAESVFTVFWLRTTPFLLSLDFFFLLIYCFHFSQ